MDMSKKKICFVVAIPSTARSFLRNHIDALSKEYEVFLAGNINSEKEVHSLAITNWHHLDIQRGISIFRDIKAVWHTYRYFRKMKFDAVHSVTPKAGLVTALGGRFAGIRHRIHIFTGQTWATRKGFMRWMLKCMDKLIVRLDNHILVDGKSQRSFLIKEGVLYENQAIVFGEGSISGVNPNRFHPDRVVRQETRSKIGIKDNQLTYIFLGRLNHDKGIGELYEAYNRLSKENKNVFLLLVGVDEGGYVKQLKSFENIILGENFHYYGPTGEPERLLNAGDVFVLPTYREGFGTSVLEAACIGLPCICSDAYGVLDAYVENVTGLRCHVGDTESLYQCMKQMYENPKLVQQMGYNSRIRAINYFSSKKITKCWVDFYHNIIK